MARTVQQPKGPTLAEVRAWPATVSVDLAARAIGISKSGAYECIRVGTFPARVLRVGGRVRVITSSIVAVLEGEDAREIA